MQHILVLGGGAAGLAAALAAAQTAKGSARITVLDRNAKVGKKLLTTGNGRCNLDNRDISPERYFTSSPKALRRLLDAVNEAAPLAWFEGLGLYPRTDEAGRVYPYSNQAADVLALLEHHLAALGVELRTGCTVRSLNQSRGGYDLQFETEAGRESLQADAVICAMGGNAGPQFGTDGFGTRFAAQCGGKLEPLYPCLTALQTAKPNRSLAGIRAKAAATLLDLDRHCTVAVENGEVQFTDYGLSGICIMQLSGHLAPGRGPKRPAVELDLFPMLDETALTALFAARVPLLPGKAPADFWTGLLNPRLGRALWAAAKLPEKPVDTLPDAAWQVLANAAKHWLFEGLAPCGWKQAQTTGGGLSLTEVTPSFQFNGCPGLYFVGETLDCAGSCGGFNLHWAFGSGIAAGRDAVRGLKRPAPKPNKKKR
jgi:predicted Rossmann fold flavoprotein